MEKQDYEISWLIPNQVALLVQNKDISIEETVKMVEKVNDLLTASDMPKVPVVVDITPMGSTGNNVGQATREFRSARSDKWGFTVVIGAKGVNQFIAQLVLQLARIEVRLAKNMDEALEIVYRIHPNITRLK
ncbi:MAG: hypothetical protein KJ043_19730 [Anaerolineae bacterium]|nr:hypothetical protein [Anaerolineae bacterium]